MRNRPKLGEILVQAGVIDDMQLRAALGEQQRWGRRLGVTLIKLGMVDEEQLLRALARQLDLPIVSLAGKRIAEDVIALVPARVASEHGVIPLFVKREGKGPAKLFLGMEDPSNLAVLDDLSFRTGLEIHPVLVTPSDVGSAIDRYYYSRGEGGTTDREEEAATSGEAVGLPSLWRLREAPDAEPPGPPSPSGSFAGSPSSPHSVPTAASPGDSELELVDEIAGEDADPSAAEPIASERLAREVERALDEVARSRRVLRALTELMVEKGLVGIEELRARIERRVAQEQETETNASAVARGEGASGA